MSVYHYVNESKFRILNLALVQLYFENKFDVHELFLKQASNSFAGSDLEFPESFSKNPHAAELEGSLRWLGDRVQRCQFQRL